MLSVTVPDQVTVDDRLASFPQLFINVEALEAQDLILNGKDNEKVPWVQYLSLHFICCSLTKDKAVYDVGIHFEVAKSIFR